MTYVVTSSTPKTLQSGRMVFPAQEVSDKEAADNQRFVDHRALTQRRGDETDEVAAAEEKAADEKAAAEAEATRKEQAEAEKPAAEKKSAPRSSGRSKAPAHSSVPTKEDQK